MTAAAIATTATVDAATITADSCPFACSRKRKVPLPDERSAGADDDEGEVRHRGGQSCH
jgi:hypothetical protein